MLVRRLGRVAVAALLPLDLGWLPEYPVAQI